MPEEQSDKMELTFVFNVNPSNRNWYFANSQEAIITEKSTMVKSIKGDHMYGKSDENVKELAFVSQVIHFLPLGLGDIFPNLKTLFVNHCNLKEISANDLRGLENLELLGLQHNKLATIPSNLLLNMKKLRFVNFSDNQLQFISPMMFSLRLSKRLLSVDFRKNKRIDKCFPDDCNTLKDLMDLIGTTCDLPIDNPEFAFFWELWTSGNFADFTIVTKKKELKVHKTVLGVQSSVFTAAFNIDMEERKSSRMKIVDFSSEAVEEFLKYFYCGKIKETNAMEIFALAAKYDVPKLQSIAEVFVAENVDEENALPVLNLGNLHESDIIMKAAFIAIKSFLKDLAIPEKMMKQPKELGKLVKAQKMYDKDLMKALKQYKKIVGPYLRTLHHND